MKRILAHNRTVLIAMTLLVVSIVGAAVAYSNPAWHKAPRARSLHMKSRFAPPAPHQWPAYQSFQHFQQPNVCPPQQPRPPFRGRAAAGRPQFENGSELPIRQFLFAPSKRAGFKSPLVVALDANGDNCISPDELARASQLLKQADANGDGNIGPAEWAPRFGNNASDFLSNNRGRGIRPGRPTVGEGRPGNSEKSDEQPEKPKDKKRKRDRKAKLGK